MQLKIEKDLGLQSSIVQSCLLGATPDDMNHKIASLIQQKTGTTSVHEQIVSDQEKTNTSNPDRYIIFNKFKHKQQLTPRGGGRSFTESTRKWAEDSKWQRGQTAGGSRLYICQLRLGFQPTPSDLHLVDASTRGLNFAACQVSRCT